MRRFTIGAMLSRRTFAALALVQLLAAVGFAQDAELRGSSGVIKLVTKAPKQFSGTLGLTLSGASGSPGYHASAGGAVVEDRLWFFASGQHEALQLRTPASGQEWDGKLAAQLGDRTSLGAAVGSGRDVSTALPSSFLSFRFDSVISGNTVFSANVTQRKGPQSPLAPFQQP